jgi:signal transduction histidine kinase
LSTLHALPRSLLTLPWWMRFSGVSLVIISFILLYILFLPIEGNPSILAIPIALAAWAFKRKGAFYSVLSIALSLWLFVSVKYYYKHDTFLLPLSTFLYFVAGTAALLFVGFLISDQRNSFDLAETARQQLEQINEQQQQLNLLKDQFILNVNHELRTPLTAVYGYLEILLEHQEHMDAQKQRIFLKNALYSCEELQLLINNVLDTMQMKYEQQRLLVEKLSLASIIHEVIIHIDPRRQQEHVLHLDIPEHLSVLANAQYLRQILRNLLSNAFKYAPINTPIELKACVWNPSNDSETPSQTLQPMICISVRDCGPGIPPQELPRLFGQFVRLERDITGTIRGTGLGLYVSKQLVEAMNGTIWVESSGIVGEGSHFRFTLPYANPFPLPSTFPITDLLPQSLNTPSPSTSQLLPPLDIPPISWHNRGKHSFKET